MNALTNTENNALAPRQQFDLSPQSFEQALTFSNYLAESDMVPKQYRGRPGDCLIAMQWGYEIGLKPLQALQSIAAVNGKPNIYGDAGKAMLLAAGCEIDEDDTAIIRATGTARCKITRPGRRPVERTYSIEDAQTAKLWGKEGPWRTNPYRQMAWRAFWFAARDAAADLLRGMSGHEETADMMLSKDMGPADVVAPPPPPAQPAWPEDSFKARLPKWQKAINEGARHDDILQFARTKGTLSPEQEKTIRELKAEVEDALPAKGAEPSPAEAVAQKLRDATTADALNEAAGLIDTVPEPADRAQLNDLFDTRMADFAD